MEMEQGNESLKHQGNRTRSYPGNNEFISEVIRTVSQIQTHRNLKNYYTLEMLWGFFRAFFIKSPGHCRAAPPSLVTATQHHLQIKLAALMNGERVSWK